MRKAGRRAEVRQLLDDHRTEAGPPPPARRRWPTHSSVPAPGARIYRVTLVTLGSENEAVQIEASSLQEAKKHAASAYLSTPGAIGLMVREVGGHAEDDS